MEQDFVDIPAFLTTPEGEAVSSNFSVTDYGRVGDQRPYQVVYPAGPAPQFMQTFDTLGKALRECQTLCQLTGKPLRLIKWGERRPCFPCGKRPVLTSNRLPSLRVKPVYTPGALEGFPDATPIADMTPEGSQIVYGPEGMPQVVGAPNYIISKTQLPPSSLTDRGPLLQTYKEAVASAEYLANAQGKQAYVCSGFGAKCRGRDPKKWVPVVYVEPGGLVRRYTDDMPLGNARSAPGSTTLITNVTPEEVQELVRQSEGATFLSQD